TIISTIVETIENHIDFGMNISAAINQPRYHFQWFPDLIFLEPQALSKKVMQKLTAMGYTLRTGSPFNTTYWGQGLAILKDPQSGTLQGATDNRRPGGKSLGY